VKTTTLTHITAGHSPARPRRPSAWSKSGLKVHPFQVLLPSGDTGLPHDSKAQAEQVRALDSSRLGPPISRLSGALMASLDDALRLHLALW